MLSKISKKYLLKQANLSSVVMQQAAGFHQVSASMNSTSSSNTYLIKSQTALFMGGSHSQRFGFSTSNDGANETGETPAFKNVRKYLILIGCSFVINAANGHLPLKLLNSKMAGELFKIMILTLFFLLCI
jgi:hypothetical protein